MRSRATNTLTRRAFAGAVAAAPLAAARALAARDVGRLGGGSHEFTLLYTNDFHSAFDPIPAYWLRGSPRLGGAAHLATLVEQERANARTAFLLDSGDMFTGTLSRLTEGEALLEMMTLMRYDAMGVGNHEFDYGWQAFERGITRVPFPTLCCNVRSPRPPRALLPALHNPRAQRRAPRRRRRHGTKAARKTIMPSKVAELEFTDPVEETSACVETLRDTVDVIVVLAHQGLPGPMQTDAESDPEVQRTLDEDLAFCAAGARHRRLHRGPLASWPRAATRASRHEDADHTDVRLRHAARPHPAHRA